MGTTKLDSEVMCTSLCGNHFVIGTANGTVHLVESKTGLQSMAVACIMHTGAIHSIQADASQEWLVSCAADGTVKVWALNGAVISSMQSTSKIACACFLNNKLDILLGTPSQLEVVRRQVYHPSSLVPYVPCSGTSHTVHTLDAVEPHTQHV